MNETDLLMKKGRLVTAAILGLVAIAMLAASQSRFSPALLFGLTVGYFNLEVLYRRVGKIDPEDTRVALRLMRTGSGLRFSAALLGAMAVIKFEFDIIGYLVGLMAPQVLITILLVSVDSRKGKR